jgi:uncharacterized protein YbjT (DUF2867 family)
VRALQRAQAEGFRPRAITRNPSSHQARALAALGIDIVAADCDSQASLEQAFRGAHGVFGVTNFWEHVSPERELAQALNIAKAAAATAVKHVIWSTLEDSRRAIPLSDTRMPTLLGRYKVPHFDAKSEADRFFREAGMPTTYLLTSFYWENFINFVMGPKRGPDGSLSITFPMGDERLPGIAAEDIGRCALGILRRGDEFAGKYVGIAGEHLSGREMAADLSDALGQPVSYNAVAPEVFRSLGFPGADDLGNMFQFNRDFSAEFCAQRSVAQSRRLNPELQSFAQWLAANARRIPIG